MAQRKPLPRPTLQPEWVTWESEYQRTGDVTYAVLAIGRTPDNPPRWAVEACRRDYEADERNARTQNPERDGKLLDEVANVMASGEFGTDEKLAQGQVPVHPAIKSVVADLLGIDRDDLEDEHAEIRRLRAAWDKERPDSAQSNRYYGRADHPRLVRACVRLAKRDGRHLFEK